MAPKIIATDSTPHFIPVHEHYCMSRMEAIPAQKNEFETTSDDSLNLEQPTAFILKLFEMINGAPDEVIAVSDFS